MLPAVGHYNEVFTCYAVYEHEHCHIINLNLAAREVVTINFIDHIYIII